MTTSNRRRGVRHGGRGSRRQPLWIDTIISESTLNLGIDMEDLMETPSQFDKFGLTLIRTLVDLTIQPESLFGAVGVQALDFGIALLEQDAFAANAVPDLNFEDDSPGRGWVVRKRTMLQDHTTAGAVPTQRHILLDLKSKRKIGDMELVTMILSNSALGTPFTVNTQGLVRCLFLK